MKRLFDVALALGTTVSLVLPILVIALAIRLTSPGPVLYWSDRVGRHNRIFKMPKFRSMRESTPTLATHLLTDPEYWITPLGAFLRKYSLDELPQVWSILKGDMSFVGPRPVLSSETELLKLRSEHGLDTLSPGLTGWAQVNGRDKLNDQEKLQYDLDYMRNWSICFDTRIIIITFLKVLTKDGVSH